MWKFALVFDCKHVVYLHHSVGVLDYGCVNVMNILLKRTLIYDLSIYLLLIILFLSPSMGHFIP